MVFIVLAWGILRTYVQFRALFALGENQQQNDGMVITTSPGAILPSHYSQPMETKDWAQNPPSYFESMQGIKA